MPSDASESPQDLDLRPHLTNTCLQQHRGEQGVRLLSELIGCTLLSDETHKTTLTAENVNDVLSQIADVLAETFRAAVQFPVHFQVRLYSKFFSFEFPFSGTEIKASPQRVRTLWS